MQDESKPTNEPTPKPKRTLEEFYQETRAERDLIAARRRLQDSLNQTQGGPPMPDEKPKYEPQSKPPRRCRKTDPRPTGTGLDTGGRACPSRCWTINGNGGKCHLDSTIHRNHIMKAHYILLILLMTSNAIMAQTDLSPLIEAWCNDSGFVYPDTETAQWAKRRTANMRRQLEDIERMAKIYSVTLTYNPVEKTPAFIEKHNRFRLGIISASEAKAIDGEFRALTRSLREQYQHIEDASIDEIDRMLDNQGAPRVPMINIHASSPVTNNLSSLIQAWCGENNAMQRLNNGNNRAQDYENKLLKILTDIEQRANKISLRLSYKPVVITPEFISRQNRYRHGALPPRQMDAYENEIRSMIASLESQVKAKEVQVRESWRQLNPGEARIEDAEEAARGAYDRAATAEEEAARKNRAARESEVRALNAERRSRENEERARLAERRAREAEMRNLW